MSNQNRKDSDRNIAGNQLKLVKLVIQDFTNALKTFHLYEADHPMISRVLDRLIQSFDSYFAKYDVLIIQLDQLHFLVDGIAVYESQDLKESLAFMFFKDGIREIRFFRGLDLNEMINFITIVRKSNIVNRMEDDLITLLWEKDFTHIEFTIIDEFFEEDGVLVPLTGEDLIKGLEYRAFGDVDTVQDDTGVSLGNGAGSEAGLGSEIESGGGIGNEIGAGAGFGNGTGSGVGLGKGTRDGTKTAVGMGARVGARTGTGTGAGIEAGAAIALGKGGDSGIRSEAVMGEHPSLVVESLRQIQDLPTDQSLSKICTLTPDEIEEIYRRAQKEEQSETLYALINNFTEILLHLGENKKTYENIVSYFDRIVKSLLEEGEIRKAVTILEEFHNLMLKIPLKENQKNTIERILQVASDSRSIEFLGKMMQRNNEADIGPITRYLQLVTQSAIDPLCFLLGTLSVDPWRKLIRERLIELCKDEIKPLVRFLSDSRASFISDLLYILGKVQHPSTLKYLTDLAYHENVTIREEVLRLATVFEEGRKDLVQTFLKDPLPKIRGKAVQIFARTAGDQGIRQLLEIILSKDFHKRSYDEKISFFKALGETGSPKAIPVLEKIIKTRRWFDKEKWEEMRNCATYSLKMIEARRR